MTQPEKSYTIEAALTINTCPIASAIGPAASVIEFEGPDGNKLSLADWLAAALEFTSSAGVASWRRENYGRVRMTVEQVPEKRPIGLGDRVAWVGVVGDETPKGTVVQVGHSYAVVDWDDDVIDLDRLVKLKEAGS